MKPNWSEPTQKHTSRVTHTIFYHEIYRIPLWCRLERLIDNDQNIYKMHKTSRRLISDPIAAGVSGHSGRDKNGHRINIIYSHCRRMARGTKEKEGEIKGFFSSVTCRSVL